MCVRLVWWLAIGCTVYGLNCGVCDRLVLWPATGCTVYGLNCGVCVRLVRWLATGCKVYGLNCGVCQIGVMTCYRLQSIRFERRCVSDWCDDWLQAVRYKVWNAVCVWLVWWLTTGCKVYGLNCGVCQIGVMTGYRLYGIRFELLCVCDWCDNWLQAAKYTVWTVVCVRLVWWLATGCTVKGMKFGVCQIGVMTGYRLYGIRFELRCVSDWCDDWLQAVRYKVSTAVCVRLVRWLVTGCKLYG